MRERPQPVDGPGCAELSRAEAGDEVATTATTGVLERREHLVDAREPAGDPLRRHRPAGHDAVPLEHRLGRGVRPSRGVALEARAAGSTDRPWSGGRPGSASAAGTRCRPAPAAADGGSGGRRARPPARMRSGARVSLPIRPGPDQVPDHLLERGVVGRAGGVGEPAEEVGAAPGERLEHGVVQRRRVEDAVVGEREVGGVGEVQRDPAVGAGKGAVAGPEDLAGGGELVEHRGGVVGHPGRQDQRLEGARRAPRSRPAARRR